MLDSNFHVSEKKNRCKKNILKSKYYDLYSYLYIEVCNTTIIEYHFSF